MKIFYRIILQAEQHDVGSVLRLLLAIVKSVQVVASPERDGSTSSRYALVVTFSRVPSQEEIASLVQEGAILGLSELADLKAVWREASQDVDAGIEMLLRAGKLKREAIDRARRRDDDCFKE